jgi:hypothetical protein
MSGVKVKSEHKAHGKTRELVFLEKVELLNRPLHWDYLICCPAIRDWQFDILTHIKHRVYKAWCLPD